MHPSHAVPAIIEQRPAAFSRTYQAAKHALAECLRVDEVKDWRDKAAAMAEYARQANDETLRQQATEVRRRAERRLGELLRETERAPAGRPAGEIAAPVAGISKPPPLRDLGITHRQSSDFQRMARVPEPAFEEAIKKPGATTASVVRLHPRATAPSTTKALSPEGKAASDAWLTFRSGVEYLLRDHAIPQIGMPWAMQKASLLDCIDEAQQARDRLDAWIAAMKAATP